MATHTLYSSLVHKAPKRQNSDRSNWLHFSCYEVALGTVGPVIHQRSQFLLASDTTSWPCTVDLHQRIISKLILHTFYSRNLLNLLTWKTDAGPHWIQSLPLGTMPSYIPTVQIISSSVRSLQTSAWRHMLLCQCTWIFLTIMLQFTHVVRKVQEDWLLSTRHNINKALPTLGSKDWRLSSNSMAMNQFLSWDLEPLFQVQPVAWGQTCWCHVLPDANTGSWRQRTISIIYFSR